MSLARGEDPIHEGATGDAGRCRVTHRGDRDCAVGRGTAPAGTSGQRRGAGAARVLPGRGDRAARWGRSAGAGAVCPDLVADRRRSRAGRGRAAAGGSSPRGKGRQSRTATRSASTSTRIGGLRRGATSPRPDSRRLSTTSSDVCSGIWVEPSPSNGCTARCGGTTTSAAAQTCSRSSSGCGASCSTSAAPCRSMPFAELVCG